MAIELIMSVLLVAHGTQDRAILLIKIPQLSNVFRLVQLIHHIIDITLLLLAFQAVLLHFLLYRQLECVKKNALLIFLSNQFPENVFLHAHKIQILHIIMMILLPINA